MSNYLCKILIGKLEEQGSLVITEPEKNYIDRYGYKFYGIELANSYIINESDLKIIELTDNDFEVLTNLGLLETGCGNIINLLLEEIYNLDEELYEEE